MHTRPVIRKVSTQYENPCKSLGLMISLEYSHYNTFENIARLSGLTNYQFLARREGERALITEVFDIDLVGSNKL